MSKYTDAELNKALDKAKIGLMTIKNSVFITTILFSMKFHWDKNIQTAETDGLNMWINPDFFMDLPPAQRIFVMAHESWHPAFQHMLRRGQRDPDLYNQAGDHVINLILKEQNYEMPDWVLADQKYTGMSTEQVYEDLKKQPTKPPSGGGGGQGKGRPMGNDVRYIDPSKQTQQQIDDQQHQILDVLVRAATQSKMSGDAAGTIPGDIAVAMEDLLNPKLPWYTLLSKYITALAKEDYSFKRFNRRFMPEFYLPGLFSETLDEIAVAVDTSASVSDQEFAAYLTELNHIHRKMKPKKMTIVDFDTSVKNVHTLKGLNDSVTKIKFTGRGGTNLHPMIDYFNKNPPTVLLVFSDLHCRAIQDKTKYPVIWVCVDNPNGQVNFGKLIHMEV